MSKKIFRETTKDILQLFLNQDPSDAIYESLFLIKKCFGADRIFIGSFDENKSVLTFINEVCSEGVASLSEIFSNDFKNLLFVEGSKYSWWINNVKNAEDTVINDIYEMPKERQTLQKVMIENEVKSMLTTSIYRKEKIYGFLCVEFLKDFHTWDETEIEYFHLFADLFSIIIEKELIQIATEHPSMLMLKSNVLFQRVFDTLPIGIELYDEKGYLIKVNPFDLEILDTKEEYILGINLFENPIIPESILERLKNGEEVVFEVDYDCNIIKQKEYFKTFYTDRIKRIVDKCIPLKDSKKNVIGYVMLVHHDVTYYQNKEQLQAYLAKLKLAVNTGNSFVWTYDVRADKIEIDYSFLDSEKNYLGFKMANYAATAKGHMDYVHKDDIESLRKDIYRLLNGEINSFTAKYRQNIKDQQYWLSTNFSVYKYDEHGKALNLICFTTDVTRQQQYEIELFKAKEANKIKRSFIENISHELRTPLNIIVGFSSLLAENANTPENQYFISLINESNQQMLTLIDSILDFAKIKKEGLKYDLEYVDIKELCKEAFALKTGTKKVDNEFVFDESQPSFLVKTDKGRIIQVIYLLLDNANKYTDNGKVTLSYHQLNSEEICIEVKDTGIGLTKEEIANIYLQFYKIDNFKPGLGLGLPISKKIVEDLGGICGVESEKGKGAIFWFTLPLACEPE